MVSAWWQHVPFAHWLVAMIQPGSIVELGTHSGVSYAAFCEAVMRCGLNTRCYAIDTWAGDAHAGTYDESVLAELRSFHDSHYPAFSNLIQSTFDDAVGYFGDGTIDLLHIDGLHFYDDVAHDFETWKPKLSSRAVVLFHDISERQNGFGVWQLWEELCLGYPNFTFIHGHGLGVLAVGDAAPPIILALCAISDNRQISTLRERFALVGERWELEYRDSVRVAEIGRLSGELNRNGALMTQIENDLRVLRDERQERIVRADTLANQTNALRLENEDLKARTAVVSWNTAPGGRRFVSRRDRQTPGQTLSQMLTSTSGMPESDSFDSTSESGSTFRRACIFSFYDEHGVIDEYVIFFLRELGKFVERILFYSNGPLSRDSEIALSGYVDEVILRPNEGYDVMAYKEGLEKIGSDSNVYDEIILANHTCYGPVFPFSELFNEMARRRCDFWGVTAHMAMTPNPLTGTGTLPYHLNANFIAVRRDMLRTQTFRKYWSEMRISASYEEAILSHEAVFTEYFTNLGYTADSYINSATYGSHYPAILDIDETLLDRNPLIKRRAFFHDPRFLEHFAADLPRALRVLEDTSDYDRSLIWQNIIRSAELRTLNTNAALTSVLPDVRIKLDAPLPSFSRMAVCVHVYYTDMLEEILTLTDTIPQPFDFIATTDTAEKKAIIEQVVLGRRNIQNVIVRVVEHNRGRDMSALFISCRDLFLDDTYELVCRLHTKKTPQVAAGRGNLFKRHMFENLLNSPGYTTNIMDMFRSSPWIGVAVPPVVQFSYWTLGHAWYNNRERAEEVAKLLRLKIKFDKDTPIAAYGTMFWFRPKALRKLFEHPWKWTDFNAEPNHVDGGLAHVLERLICYVAQDARYTTQQVMNPQLAGWNYGVLEYKLQKLAAALPNSDFGYQCEMVEGWKRAGYPMQPTAALPSSVSRSLSDLMMVIKKSIAYRSPAAFRLLRPTYRLLIGKRHQTRSERG